MTKEPIQYIITDLTGSYTLQYSPEGWDKTDVKLMRSEKYRAINKSISDTAFKFVKDGRKILLKNFCLYGVQAECTLTINTLNTVTQEYVLLGTYDFDFSTFEIIKDFVVVNLKRGGLIEKINARENIVYELPEIETHADRVAVTIEFPKLLESRKLFINQENFLFPFDATNIYQSVNGHTNQYVGLTQYADEVSTTGTIQTDRDWSDVVWYPPPNYLGSDTFFLQINSDVDKITFTYNISGTIQVFQPGQVACQVLLCNMDFSLNHLIYSSLTSGAFTANGSVTFTNNNTSHAFYLILLYGWAGKYNISSNQYELDFNGSIEVLNYSKPANKSIYAWTAKTVYKELLRKIDETTPGYPSIQSYLLDYFDNILLTSGDALRGLMGGMKTSFNDFFKFCDVVFGGVGFKVDDTEKAILESIYNFYPDTQIVSLGEVSNLSIKPYQQFFASSVDIGYKDVNIDNGSINGKFAFNTAQNYTLPITKVEKKEDLLCPYIADPVSITLTAINRENKTTTDSSQDNDIFILVCKSTGTGTAILERDNDYVNAPTGFMTQEGIFNTLISPKRLMLYRTRIFASMLFQLTDKNIKFTSTNKNKELISRRVGETANIVEKDNIDESLFLPPLFRPELIECEAPITKQTIAALSTVDGYLSFTYNGVSLKGYIYDIGYEADRINKFKLTLISHKDNDYTNI